MRLYGDSEKKDGFGTGHRGDESRKRGRRRRRMRRVLRGFGYGRGHGRLMQCEDFELRQRSGWVLCLWIQWTRMKCVGGKK